MVLMGWFSENLFHSIYPSFTENRRHYTASTLYIQISLVLLSYKLFSAAKASIRNHCFWRPRDRRLDDRYTAASVKPSPRTVNTRPHTQAVVYTLNI